MATPKQIAANRKNSRKSTGPTSPEGKAIVSQNRLVHGLLGRFRVLEGENQQQYDALLDELMVDQKPVGLLETELVKKMSEHLWLSQRAQRFQEGCFVVVGRTPEQIANDQAEMAVLPGLERFTELQAHHDRALQKALTALLKLRKERQTQQIGFEREKRSQAEEERRDKRQNQRDQAFKVRHAVAQIDLQLKQQRLLNASAPSGAAMQPPTGPDFQKMAA